MKISSFRMAEYISKSSLYGRLSCLSIKVKISPSCQEGTITKFTIEGFGSRTPDNAFEPALNRAKKAFREDYTTLKD